MLESWCVRKERSRLWRVARHLDAVSLTCDEEDAGPLVPEDFLVPETRAARHFLGFYSAAGIEYALRAYGVWERMERAASSGRLVVRFLDASSRLERLQVLDADRGDLVGEIRAGFWWRGERQWLYVDWILSQRPGEPFDPRRPKLPGQEHPGGGIGLELMEIVLIMGQRLRCDGVIGRPSHFHNAVLYRPHFRFEDPASEGFYRAVVDAWQASGMSLGEASWAVLEGRLLDAGGGVVKWEPSPMLAPLVPGAELEDDAWEQAASRRHGETKLVLLPRAATPDAGVSP